MGRTGEHFPRDGAETQFSKFLFAVREERDERGKRTRREKIRDEGKKRELQGREIQAGKKGLFEAPFSHFAYFFSKKSFLRASGVVEKLDTI